MTKSYLEPATDAVTEMIKKGYLRVAVDTGMDWKSYNRESIHTVGWAILEMYREIQGVPQRAKDPPKAKEQSKLITR